MKTQEAKELGVRITTLAKAEQMTQACALLAPVIAERTPFPLLGHIGESIGDYLLEMVNAFLEHVGYGKTGGGWVVISSGLKTQLGRDLSGAFNSLPRLYHRWRCLVCGRHSRGAGARGAHDGSFYDSVTTPLCWLVCWACGLCLQCGALNHQ